MGNSPGALISLPKFKFLTKISIYKKKLDFRIWYGFRIDSFIEKIDSFLRLDAWKIYYKRKKNNLRKIIYFPFVKNHKVQ